MIVSPYLCADSHPESSISLVPVYSAETNPIGKIGCNDCIGSLDTVDTFTTGRSDADLWFWVTIGRPKPMVQRELVEQQWWMVPAMV